jgi:hypothetical protein
MTDYDLRLGQQQGKVFTPHSPDEASILWGISRGGDGGPDG